MQPEQSTIQTPTETHLSRPRLARYLLALLALPLALYLLPFLLVRLPGFETWSGAFYGPALDFGFAASGQNADVVIFGDSSALFGIDPREMSAALGVRVINLPNTLGSLPVTGDMALRRYLRSNRPPRLILFYFAPWNLNYSHEEASALIYEGEEMLARHGNLHEILSFTRTHPFDPFLFPFKFYSAVPKATLLAHLRHQDRAGTIARAMGHVEVAASVPRLTAPCRLPAKLLRPPAFDSAQSLVAKYSSPQTQTLIFIAPIPACDNASDLAGRSYSALPAAPPKQMPPHSYKDDSFYIHLDPSAVPDATQSLIDAIRPALGDAPAPAIH